MIFDKMNLNLIEDGKKLEGLRVDEDFTGRSKTNLC